jgi:pyrroline-5-carboxylate reductase
MKIGFIGAGNMGGAYIKALEKHEVYFVEKNQKREEEIEKDTNAKGLHDLKNLVDSTEVIVIAVKPQILDKVLHEMAEIDLEGKVIISLVVGVKIFHYKKLLGDNIKFVRVMPNTPSLIGKGICGYTTYNLEEIDEINTRTVLEATGKALKVEEDKLDMITAISGSGPAYVFLLINALADGGVKLGLSKTEAIELASETFIGAASMVMETGMHPEMLKDMVTSPGGTTAEGLAVMEAEGVRSAMIKTAKATFTKAKELGNKEE